MNHVRNLAVLIATLGVAWSQAQSFELRPRSGATLVGNTFLINPGQTTFQVEIWANYNGPVLGWVLALAFDTTGGIGISARRDGGPLNVTQVERAPAFATWNSNDSFSPPNLQRAAATNTAAGGNFNFVTRRAFISYTQLTQTLGSPTVDINQSALVMVATISSSMTAGDIFGDSLSEAGLFLFNAGGVGAPPQASSGSFGLVNPRSQRFGSIKYQVQAVPEPASILAFLGGVAALARRRAKMRGH